MSDNFRHLADGLNTPARQGFAITPADGADLATVTRALYIGGAGDIVAILAGDTSPLTFRNVPAGTVLPLRVLRLRSTGTTATNLVGLV